MKEFKEAIKGMTESGRVFNKDGKCIGFIDFRKPSGQNEGYDCPVKEYDLVKEPETIKEKLKRISKPNLIEVDNEKL